MNQSAEAALVETFRREWPRLVSATVRVLEDLQAAEDVVQETLLTALDRWPLVGVPDRPGAWLLTAARHRALNARRDADRARQRVRAAERLAPPQELGAPGADLDVAEIEDDRLRLMVFCCHPALSQDAQIALTLRMVSGLTTEEIARGFQEQVATTAQRLSRAKRTLLEYRATFTDDPDLPARLPSVLQVIYLLFNEGYLPTTGKQLTRTDLAVEAHRLARLLTELVPGESEAWALRALLAFQLSRSSTRADAGGGPATLETQERSRWDRTLIAEGVECLERATTEGSRGPLALQAALAAHHATAASFAATDWTGIVGLYDELLELAPSPLIALNRAVAVAMADGPEAALPLLDQLVEDPALRRSHRPWAIRADLYRRLGHDRVAIADYDRALELVGNEAERRYLTSARSRLVDLAEED